MESDKNVLESYFLSDDCTGGAAGVVYQLPGSCDDPNAPGSNTFADTYEFLIPDFDAAESFIVLYAGHHRDDSNNFVLRADGTEGPQVPISQVASSVVLTQFSSEPGAAASCDGFGFSLNNFAQTAVPGGRVFYGATTSTRGFGAPGEEARIQHVLDPNEVFTDNPDTGIGIVYGDWHGVRFDSVSGQNYKYCFNARRGDFDFDSPATFDDDGTSVSLNFRGPERDDAPTNQAFIRAFTPSPDSLAWSPYSGIFQANDTGFSNIHFRTGSFRDGWFTGDLI